MSVKSEVVPVRWSQPDLQRVRAAADREGLAISSFIRQLILSELRRRQY